MTLVHRRMCDRGLRATMLAAGPAALISAGMDLIDGAAAQNNPPPVSAPQTSGMQAAPVPGRTQTPIGPHWNCG